MDDIILAADYLKFGDPDRRMRAARRIMGICCIDNRAKDVARTEGLLDTIFSLAKSDDHLKARDGAFILFSLMDDARDDVVKHSDFYLVTAKLEKSQDMLLQVIGKELRYGVAGTRANRPFPSDSMGLSPSLRKADPSVT
jgi:hypothetical protein